MAGAEQQRQSIDCDKQENGETEAETRERREYLHFLFSLPHCLFDFFSYYYLRTFTVVWRNDSGKKKKKLGIFFGFF